MNKQLVFRRITGNLKNEISPHREFFVCSCGLIIRPWVYSRVNIFLKVIAHILSSLIKHYEEKNQLVDIKAYETTGMLRSL